MVYDKHNDKCRYFIGGLQNKIFLFPFSKDSLVIKTDDKTGNAYASGLNNEIGYELKCASVVYNSETSIDNNAFKFEHTLTIKLTETMNHTYYDIIERIITQKWIVAFADKNGNYFVMNYEFPIHSDYSYSFNDTEIANVATITMKCNSNYPTFNYNDEIKPKLYFKFDTCEYNIGKVKKFFLIEKDKAIIKATGDTFTMSYTGDSFKEIQPMSDTLEYIEEYQEDSFHQQITFSVPLEHYEYYFHYSLLQFQDNRYYGVIYDTNENVLLIGNRVGLFPTYNIQTSEDNNVPNKINITLDAYYTHIPILVYDTNSDIIELKEITYEAVDSICSSHSVMIQLIRVYEDGVETDKYYCLEGTKSSWVSKGYNIIGEYSPYANGFGFPIITGAYCNAKRRVQEVCSETDYPKEIHLQGFGATTAFTITSGCDLRFTPEGCVHTTYDGATLTVLSQVPKGQCKIKVCINACEFEDEIDVYIHAPEDYRQEFWINYFNQTVPVVLHEDIINIQLIENNNPIELEINDNNDGYNFIVPKNETNASRTFTITFTYKDGLKEIITIHQSMSADPEDKDKEKEKISNDLYYKWVGTDEYVCLEEGQQTNCETTQLDLNGYLCVDGNKYQRIINYISPLCDGKDFIYGYTLGELIEEGSGDCVEDSHAKPRPIPDDDSEYWGDWEEEGDDPPTPPDCCDRVDALEIEMPLKQDILVSGTNIKTINGESILGEGNITIQGGTSGNYLPLSGGTLTGHLTLGTTAETAFKKVETIRKTSNGTNGAAFYCNSDGSAAFFHKTYNGTSATNDAIIKFDATQLKYVSNGQRGVNATTEYDIMTSKNTYTKAEVDALIQALRNELLNK